MSAGHKRHETQNAHKKINIKSLWGPMDHMIHPTSLDFEVWYLTAQMELDQVFGHFWHLQPETFLAKKELRKNIVFQKSYDRKCVSRSAFFENFSFKMLLFELSVVGEDNSVCRMA